MGIRATCGERGNIAIISANSKTFNATTSVIA